MICNPKEGMVVYTISENKVLRYTVSKTSPGVRKLLLKFAPVDREYETTYIERYPEDIWATREEVEAILAERKSYRPAPLPFV